MIMDPNYEGFTTHTNGFDLDKNPNLESGFDFNIPSPNNYFPNPSLVETPDFSANPGLRSIEPHTSWNPEGEGSSPTEESLSSEPLFRYLSQMLMDENLEDHRFMVQDPLALKVKEKSLYDVIGEEYPPPLNTPQANVNHESPGANTSGSGSYSGGNVSTSASSPSGDNIVEAGSGYSLSPPSVNELMRNIFSDRESVLQFNRGLEEARKFLPSANQLVIDSDSSMFATSGLNKVTSSVVVEEEKVKSWSSPASTSRERKNRHEREEAEFEEARSNKQSAVYCHDADSELSDQFDKVLLYVEPRGGPCIPSKTQPDEVRQSKSEVRNQQPNKSKVGKSRSKGRGKTDEAVDLCNLLILCAQAISANDFRTANELLKSIRQHASAIGDGSRRLAHYMANGLEARLAGQCSGMQNFYNFLTFKRMPAAEILNAYKTLLQACPFMKFSIFFAGKAILRATEKASTLHIIDFGILYGFHWPILIQHISRKEGGPPKLRFTGIELVQRGFRPTETIDETGRRLEKYCKQFNVPFEYNPIASQDWETIKIEDLKLRTGEVVAVNCLTRFHNLLDETTEVNCQRDAVLSLIRKLNPDIFVNTIINGSYNSPFFIARFREALFFYSAVFDMLDSTLPHNDQERFLLESEFYGRDAMNIAACEGRERMNRPETYKQWRVRMARAGFNPLPLNQDDIRMFMERFKQWYHKDFVMDTDKEWMLQGWKGKTIYASSCWVPA